MKLLLDLISALTAFSVVMLALSLLVMIIIRGLHFMANRRGRGLAEMLASLMFAYRGARGDVALAGDAAETQFVLDVLTHPLGCESSARAEAVCSRAARLQEAPRQPGAASKRAASERRALADLAARVEQLTAAELKLIVSDCAQDRLLPERWFTDLPEKRRSLGDFQDYIDTRFAMADAASSRAFRAESKRLSLVLSALLVVVLNVDAFSVFESIQRSPELRRGLEEAAPGLLEMSERIAAAPPGEPGHATQRGELVDEVTTDLTRLSSLLNEPKLAIGWDGSRIARAFCQHRGRCLQSADPEPPTGPLFLELGRWMAGLLLAIWLIAQGPPFWADVLKRLLSWGPRRQAKERSARAAGGDPGGA